LDNFLAALAWLGVVCVRVKTLNVPLDRTNLSSKNRIGRLI
jgi:hypothetical protein